MGTPGPAARKSTPTPGQPLTPPGPPAPRVPEVRAWVLEARLRQGRQRVRKQNHEGPSLALSSRGPPTFVLVCPLPASHPHSGNPSFGDSCSRPHPPLQPGGKGRQTAGTEGGASPQASGFLRYLPLGTQVATRLGAGVQSNCSTSHQWECKCVSPPP